MARDRGARPMANITSRCCECPSQQNAWQGTCSSIWREGTCFLSFHTSDFRPWSKNCRMSWPPIQLVQTDTQTRKEWQTLRTAFTPSPRSWLNSWIALMAAHCPSHPGVWNLCPLAPSYLLISSWPQNNGKPLTCTWERLLHKRRACGQIYRGVGVVILPFLSSRNQALLPKGLKHNPYIYRTLPLPAATETAIKQTGNPAYSCAFKRMSR